MSEPAPLLTVRQDDLDDLRRRLRATRWPAPWPVEPWSAGTDPDELRRLVAYWADGYDWRHWETVINALPSYVADLGGHRLHYLRFDAVGPAAQPGALPVVLTNGWPSTFFEMVELAQRLADPDSHGAAGAEPFTVIVPSLPGFTFSEQRPSLPADMPTHELWHRLMTEELGFSSYAAHGGDLGAGITSRLAQAHPESVLGIHLMAVGAPPAAARAELSADEQDYLARVAAWTRAEGGYLHQQATRPLSLAYGLSDSPTGLLGWIVDKYRAWSDNDGTLSAVFTDDFLLTQASLYWFTNTIGTSFRPYYEYGRGVSRELPFVDVPTAVTLFPADISQPPRSWVERSHRVARYDRAPRGGHFAPVEVPELLAAELRSFLGTLQR